MIAKRYLNLALLALIPLSISLTSFRCAESHGESSVSDESETSEKDLEMKAGEKIRAFTFDAWDKPNDDVLVKLSSMGVSHLSLTSFGWQSSYDHPEVHMKPDAKWYTEGVHGIRELAAKGRELGIGIILKPHIWLSNSAAEEFYDGKTIVTKKWRSDIGFDSEEKWKQWEETYSKFAMYYANLAEEIGADVYCFGTELANPMKVRPDYWFGLIKEIRKVYSGKLTYAGNWYEEYSDVPFWSELDYIGVQAYFPLSKEENPSKEQIKEGWIRHMEQIKAVSDKAGKPVLFTELGYRSVSFAAEKPWTWASRADVDKVKPDYEMQSKLYEAFFETYWDIDWFSGVILWKWQPASDRRGASSRRAIDFTPQDKPAEKVIAKWFNK